MAPKRLDLHQRLTRIEARLDAIDAAIAAIRAQRLPADRAPPPHEEGQIARMRRLNAEARARKLKAEAPRKPGATTKAPRPVRPTRKGKWGR